VVGDSTVAVLAHHRWRAPLLLLRLPHGRGLWDGPADLRGHEVRLRMVDRFYSPMHTRVRQCRMPTACSSVWHSMECHGPPHGFGALFGHGLEHAGELLVDLGVVAEDQGDDLAERLEALLDRAPG
jgi:hypothetical protein